LNDGSAEVKQLKKEGERLQKLNDTLDSINNNLLREKAEMNAGLARERKERRAEWDWLEHENRLLSVSLKEFALFVKSLDEYGSFCKD
jgi:hypothetical protein